MIRWRLLRPRIKSLFLKIFLCSWAAMTVAGTVLLYLETARSQRIFHLWQGVTGDAFAFYAVSVIKGQSNAAASSSGEFLTDLKSRTGIQAWIFDDRGNEVSGYNPQYLRIQPPWVRAEMNAVVSRARTSNETAWSPLGSVTLAAHSARSRQGRRYTLLGQLPSPRYKPWQARPYIQILRLLAVLVASGLVSWVLSRQLTAPISALRTATGRLAGGDLSARASDGMAGRHDELAELGRDFDRMAARLEVLLDEQQQLMGAQLRLLRYVSHELRSPLARVSVALELARDSLAASESTQASALAEHPTTQALDRIERENVRLNKLIDRLLMLSRLESGILASEFVLMDLAALLHSVVADANFEARALNRRVILTRCDACSLLGNNELLRSTIENVLRNAVRHTPEHTTVTVALQHQDETACITVCDQGPGIPAAELQDIFQPFYRVGGTRETRSGGTGLGLAIAERAARHHGGSVQAANAAEGGLKVEICLPLKTH